MSGRGISWAICKSAPRSRQITMPAPHHSVFTGRMPLLPPNQQHQSTTKCKFRPVANQFADILVTRHPGQPMPARLRTLMSRYCPTAADLQTRIRPSSHPVAESSHSLHHLHRCPSSCCRHPHCCCHGFRTIRCPVQDKTRNKKLLLTGFPRLASTPPLSVLQARCPSSRPTNSVKALKAVSWLQNASKLLGLGLCTDPADGAATLYRS